MRKLIKERWFKGWLFKYDYVLRTEEISGEEARGAPVFKITSAFTPDGDYIGDSKMAYRLCKKMGIRPEKANPSHRVCSIGFSIREDKWYGWSHRAICGFGIGDTVKEGDCTASPGSIEEWVKDHPEDDLSLPIGFTARTLEDAKRMAIAFADSVG